MDGSTLTRAALTRAALTLAPAEPGTPLTPRPAGRATHVHGAGEAVLLHEELELRLLARVGRLGLPGGEVAEGVEALAAAGRVVAAVGEQGRVGHAGGGAGHRGDRLADEGQVGDAGCAV